MPNSQCRETVNVEFFSTSVSFDTFLLQDALSWLMANFTYTPNMNYIGMDSFRFFVRDQHGVTSQLLVVDIDVYEPCISDDCLCEGLFYFLVLTGIKNIIENPYDVIFHIFYTFNCTCTYFNISKVSRPF